MAMLITKFNNMIRSKILWGGFAVIICVSFVGTGLSLRGTGCDREDPDTVGMLFDKPVSRREFAKARFFELGMRPDAGNITEDQREEFRKSVWKRIAVLRAAKSMGITVPDSEIRDLIQSEPAFATGGTFDKERYRNIIQSSRGVRIETFEEYLREQLAITKLANTLAAMAWTPPSRIDEQMADLTDTFTIQYVAITTNNLERQPEVTEDDAREFFDENSELFEVPERRNVRYVAFAISNYLGGAEITNDDIQDYYYAHTNEFTAETTNNTRVLIPLTNVEDRIREVLVRREAVAEARGVATEFEMAMASGRDAAALTMEEAAEAQGLTIRTSKLFAIYEPVPGLGVGADFNRAAFKLTSDPENYFSGAITGESNVYVIATATNIPTHIPKFDDVVDDVMPAAGRNAVRTALDEKGNEIHASINEALEGGKTFSNAVTDLKLDLQEPEPFSLYQTRSGLGLESMSNHIEHIRTLAPAVAKLYEGELTGPQDAFDARLIARVVSRIPSAPFVMQMLRPRVMETLNGINSSAVFADWQDDVLAGAKLEDFAMRRRREAAEND